MATGEQLLLLAFGLVSLRHKVAKQKVDAQKCGNKDDEDVHMDIEWYNDIEIIWIYIIIIIIIYIYIIYYIYIYILIYHVHIVHSVCNIYIYYR